MRTKRIIPVLVAAAALAIPAAASAAPGSVNCTDNSLSGTTVNANVTVPAGQTCWFWGTINGNVTANGKFMMSGGEVTGNVTVNQGGLFQAFNYGVTIDKNLTITNPADAYASPIGGNNGFYGNQGGTTNVVKGNVTFTMDPSLYAPYTWPSLYFGGGTTVGGTVNYNAGGLAERPLDTNGLTGGR